MKHDFFPTIILICVIAWAYFFWILALSDKTTPEQDTQEMSVIGKDIKWSTNNIATACIKIDTLLKNVDTIPMSYVQEYFSSEKSALSPSWDVIDGVVMPLWDNIVFEWAYAIDDYCYTVFKSSDEKTKNIFKFKVVENNDSQTAETAYTDLLWYLSYKIKSDKLKEAEMATDLKIKSKLNKEIQAGSGSGL